LSVVLLDGIVVEDAGCDMEAILRKSRLPEKGIYDTDDVG